MRAVRDQKLDAKTKPPFAVVRKDRSLFGFAGLWERWEDKASGEVVQSFTIITTGGLSDELAGRDDVGAVANHRYLPPSGRRSEALKSRGAAASRACSHRRARCAGCNVAHRVLLRPPDLLGAILSGR